MKFLIRILTIVFICFFFLAVSINPLIIFVAREQLKTRLPGSAAVISGCNFNPFRGISLKGIRISKEPVYDLRISLLAIGFNHLKIFKVFQGDPVGAVQSCEIVIDSLEINKSRLTGGYLKVSRTNDNGVVGCAEFKYEKLKVLDITGKASLKDDSLNINSLSGKLLGGFLKSDSLIELNPSLRYQAKIDFTNLDLNTFMNDFAFDEKAEVSGTVSGLLKLRGDNRSIEVMEGNLSSSKEGGILTIKDTEFLRNMARSSGQALDLVVESFKNYRYNTGKTILSLEDNNLVFLVNLDGNAGKRGLNIILHDLNPGRKK